jgi:hypothetical protein
MKEYPDYLPRPLRRNYNISHISPFARTEMVTGRARQRRTFTTVPSLVTVDFHMNQSEAPLFEAWFKYEITDGAEWFLAPLRTPEAPIGPLKMYECRFTSMYSGPTFTDDDEWDFSAELETRERPILSEEWYLYGQPFLTGARIIDIALNSKWPSA